MKTVDRFDEFRQRRAAQRFRFRHHPTPTLLPRQDSHTSRSSCLAHNLVKGTAASSEYAPCMVLSHRALARSEQQCGAARTRPVAASSVYLSRLPPRERRDSLCLLAVYLQRWLFPIKPRDRWLRRSNFHNVEADDGRLLGRAPEFTAGPRLFLFPTLLYLASLVRDFYSAPRYGVPAWP